MTKHKIDDLFQQKLAGSEASPSPAAWSKLESQLAQNKKKGIIFWMSLAASIALVVTFGWLVLKSEGNVITDQPIAQNNTGQLNSIIVVDSAKNQTKAIEEAAIIKNEESSKTEIKQQQVDKKVIKPNEKTQRPVKKQKAPLILIQHESNLAENNASTESSIDKSKKEVPDQILLEKELNDSMEETLAINKPLPSKESGSIKIVYTLKPAISKEAIAEQNSIEKVKTSPFKKAVAFAKNIKENPKGIGNLREAKNNLLSFKKNDSK